MDDTRHGHRLGNVTSLRAVIMDVGFGWAGWATQLLTARIARGNGRCIFEASKRQSIKASEREIAITFGISSSVQEPSARQRRHSSLLAARYWLFARPRS